MVCSDHLGPSNDAFPCFLLFVRIRSVARRWCFPPDGGNDALPASDTRRRFSCGVKLRSPLRYVIAVHLPFAHPPPPVLSGL